LTPSISPPQIKLLTKAHFILTTRRDVKKLIKRKGFSGGVIEVVELLPSKPEALSSNSSTDKKGVRFKNY
jgi:hypothetical protein